MTSKDFGIREGEVAVELPAQPDAGLYYIGRVRTPWHERKDCPKNARESDAVCTVEVDPATGKVEILRYVVSEDCGVMINPMVVEGQIAGGVVQGIGGVLYEHLIYDEDGNPLTTTFLDYLVPTAAEVPAIEYGHVETRSPTPGGHKGMGEGGAIGSPPCVFNAVADAVAARAGVLTEQPLTPSRILAALTR